VDTGTAAGAPATDLRGVARPQFGGVDMGAYECTVRARFAADPPNVNAPGADVRFTDTSLSKLSPLNAWSWNFGDTATSALQNPVHSYANKGTYTVALDVAGPDDAGSCTGTYAVADGTPLKIVQYPKGCIAVLGTPYTMSVQTVGGFGTVHYQWKKNGHNLTDSVDAPAYTIAQLAEADAGYYVCEVSDDYSTLESFPAEIYDPIGLPISSRGIMALLAVLFALSGAFVLLYRVKDRKSA
jgi:hypothetical protein